MANSNNPQVDSMWQSYSNQSTARTKLIGEAYRIPDSPYCHEEKLYNVGDTVISTGNGELKAGMTMTVDAIQKQSSGYVAYLAGGVWNKQQDIKPQ